MTSDRFKTREPDARFQSQVPDFTIKTREPRRKYKGAVSGNEQPTTEAQPEPAIPADTQTTPKRHANDTKKRYRTWRNEQESNDTQPTPSRHPNDTNSLEFSSVNGSGLSEESRADLLSNDTQTTLKRHPNDTDLLKTSHESGREGDVSLATDQSETEASNDTQTTLKRHPNDTNSSCALGTPVESIWAITGLRRSVLFGLFDIARERGGATNILGITYDEVAFRSKVKSTSVRTTMKRLRDEGWITIMAKRGNNRTINVDVCYAYQQFASDLSGPMI